MALPPIPLPAEGFRMAGPPMAPPESPSLSAYPLEGEGQAATPHQAGAIPKVVFGIMQQIDVLARTLPGGSEDLEKAKSLIQGAMIKALRGGTGRPLNGAEPSY
jgi:hypothetical protein